MKSLTAALIAIALTGTAHAQSADSDVQCLVVANALGPTGKDEASRNFAGTVAAFYLGRVGGLSASALTPALRKAGRTFTGPESVKALQDCGARMKTAHDSFFTTAKQVLAVKP